MKIIKLIFLLLYIYVVTFGIFLNDYFQIPAPFIMGFPLVFLFRNNLNFGFIYTKEVLLIGLGMFMYYGLGLSQFNSFAANLISVGVCAAFFNYYVGNNLAKFNQSIGLFYLLLISSSVIMMFDHYYDLSALRSLLIGDHVLQSPAGIAQTKFTFGYQLAALSPFLVVVLATFKKSVLLQVIALFACLIFILFGMQRSVFVSFLVAISLFAVVYYRFKAIIVLIVVAACCFFIYTYYVEGNLNGVGNIITKSEQSNESQDRSNLLVENLKIFADYPFGLIFYGKSWSDVVYRDPVFYEGITSHNAYIMFITYLGPFLGVGLLLGIFSKVSSVFLSVLKEISDQKYALLISLCFSFLGVSINSLSHNDWLISANGPTIFIYFSILHLYRIHQSQLIS